MTTFQNNHQPLGHNDNTLSLSSFRPLALPLCPLLRPYEQLSLNAAASPRTARPVIASITLPKKLTSFLGTSDPLPFAQLLSLKTVFRISLFGWLTNRPHLSKDSQTQKACSPFGLAELGLPEPGQWLWWRLNY